MAKRWMPRYQLELLGIKVDPAEIRKHAGLDEEGAFVEQSLLPDPLGLSQKAGTGGKIPALPSTPFGRQYDL